MMRLSNTKKGFFIHKAASLRFRKGFWEKFMEMENERVKWELLRENFKLLALGEKFETLQQNFEPHKGQKIEF